MPTTDELQDELTALTTNVTDIESAMVSINQVVALLQTLKNDVTTIVLDECTASLELQIHELEAQLLLLKASSNDALFEAMSEPTGFPNQTDSTISFVEATRVFTIAPVGDSFRYYRQSDAADVTTAQSITIPNTTGDHFIYFDKDFINIFLYLLLDLFEVVLICCFYWHA